MLNSFRSRVLETGETEQICLYCGNLSPKIAEECKKYFTNFHLGIK